VQLTSRGIEEVLLAELNIGEEDVLLLAELDIGGEDGILVARFDGEERDLLDAICSARACADVLTWSRLCVVQLLAHTTITNSQATIILQRTRGVGVVRSICLMVPTLKRK